MGVVLIPVPFFQNCGTFKLRSFKFDSPTLGDLGWDVFLLKTEKILKPYIANIPSQKTMQTTACGHRLAHTYPTPLGTMIFRKLEQHLFMHHLVGNTFGNPFGLKTIAPTYTIDQLSKDVGAGLGSTGDPIQISIPP